MELSAVHAVAYLFGISIISFFSCQLMKEGFQYIVHVPMQVHSLVKKYRAIDLLNVEL
jgi:hypothetical protein